MEETMTFQTLTRATAVVVVAALALWFAVPFLLHLLAPFASR